MSSKSPILRRFAGPAVFLAGLVHGQQLPFPTYPNPTVLHVGAGATTVRIGNQDYHPGLVALWNGSPRQTTIDSSFSTVYTVQLAAEDVAAPQLAVLTMVDSNTGVVVDSINCPVGYDVLPAGIALDAARNRLYISTPAQVGDPQFPPNSVVAYDLAAGKIAGSARFTTTLGDLALSDDGTALYVIVEGSGTIKRLDPVALATKSEFSFRPATPAFTTDRLTVMPGHPETVAVLSRTSSSFVDIGIYDNGVKRSNVFNYCCGTSTLMFSPDGKYIFANSDQGFFFPANSPVSGSQTFRFSVDSTGIQKQAAVYAPGGGPVGFSGNTLYSSISSSYVLATAIDTSRMQVAGNFGIAGPLAVDAASQRAFILYAPPAYSSSGSTPPPELIAFALPNLEAMGTHTIGVSSIQFLPESEKLLRFGKDGFAVPSTLGLLIFHSPLAGPAPAATAGSIVNAASQKLSPVAPGEILTIYGANLGPSAPQTPAGAISKFPSQLAGVQVLFGSYPGNLLLASDGVINVAAPFELQPGTNINLQILYYGIPSAKISMPVVAAAPALFTRNGSGGGPVVVVNQDGSINTPSPPGSFVTLYGTGGGVFDGAIDGDIVRRGANLAGTARVSIAGRDAQVLYAGAAPGLISAAFQLNVKVPGDVPSGSASIVVNIQGQDSPQGATLEIR